MLQIIYSEEMMIKINNLTKKYKEKYAVNNLNLEIKSGELFSLLRSEEHTSELQSHA